MCAPAAIPYVLMAVSAAVSVKSAVDQGNYQQKVAENNALSSKYAADDAIARGAVAEQQQRNKTRAMLGQQRAALAANGIDATTGSGSLLLTDAAGFGEYDALAVRNNAMKQAYGLNVQADNLMAEGAAAKSAANNKAFSSILSSASSMYGAGARAGYWGGASAASSSPSMPDFMRGGR